MPKKLESIENLLREWELLKARAKHKGEGLFGDRTEFNLLTRLFDSLAINSMMSISELVAALQILENISIKTKSTGSDLSFAEDLKQRHYRNLNAFEIPAAVKPAVFFVAEDTNLHRFLIKNHQTLLNYYERAYYHAQGEIPVSEINYSGSQLQESQAFYDLETTSLAAELPDKSTVLKDLKRKGVTIYGAVIHQGNPNDEKDPMTLETIQNFATDSLDVPHSKASKILNFGGQFLEAMILQEFSNTTMFADTGIFGIEQGYVKGHINWTKEPDTRDIYATVTMKIFTCAYADPVDTNEPQKFFTMASDGTSLIEVDYDELPKIMQRCSAEVEGITEDNVTPICELNAKIILTANKFNRGYMLKVGQFKTQYNTPDLVSNRSPDFRQTDSISLS